MKRLIRAQLYILMRAVFRWTLRVIAVTAKQVQDVTQVKIGTVGEG